MELLDAVKAAISGESAPTGGNDDSIASAAPAGADDQAASGGDSAAPGASGDENAAGGETPAGDDVAGGGGDADAAAKDEGAGDGADDGGDEEGGETPAPRARDAQGRFVKADGAVDEDQKPRKGEPGHKADEKPAAVAKAPDPINDPPPAGLSQKATERFQTLVSTAKTLTAERDQAVQDRDLLVQQVESTGATPEQYVETLNILRDINSGDPAAEERAYDYLMKATAALGARLGKVNPGEDPLTGHQDLITEVVEGKITRARAEEIALNRRAQAANATRQQVQQQTQQERDAQTAAIREGTAALNTLEAQLKAADPVVFAAKRATVIRLARPALKNVPPQKWAETFKALWDATPVPKPATTPAPTGGKPGVPANQPLRGKPSAGSQRAAPKSHEDAVRQSLGL